MWPEQGQAVSIHPGEATFSSNVTPPRNAEKLARCRPPESGSSFGVQRLRATSWRSAPPAAVP